MTATTDLAISRYKSLLCTECGKDFDTDVIQHYSACERSDCAFPLSAQYELPLRESPETMLLKRNDMWRYAPFLPVNDLDNIVSLGEGNTPLLELPKLGKLLGMDRLLMKDESLNPTGSFKARGLSAAVSKARELGVRHCVIPTAGNAGGALAAYCARAGMKASVVMPSHTPEVFQMECRYFGADLHLVDGLISDCGARVKQIVAEYGAFDVSTMKEPFRQEGKKTMGYEIAEQLGWVMPDVILYPTGGGTGLIGIWKAFHELKAMGWIQGTFPRMIAVQADNCKPIVELIKGKRTFGEAYKGKASLANGLAVPAAFAERLIYRIITESNGEALAIADHAMLQGVKQLAAIEGLFVAPEGGALVMALQSLLSMGKIDAGETILLLNTGTAYKYIENMEQS